MPSAGAAEPLGCPLDDAERGCPAEGNRDRDTGDWEWVRIPLGTLGRARLPRRPLPCVSPVASTGLLPGIGEALSGALACSAFVIHVRIW